MVYVGWGMIPVAGHGGDPQLPPAGWPDRAAGGAHTLLSLLPILWALHHPSAPHRGHPCLPSLPAGRAGTGPVMSHRLTGMQPLWGGSLSARGCPRQ